MGNFKMLKRSGVFASSILALIGFQSVQVVKADNALSTSTHIQRGNFTGTGTTTYNNSDNTTSVTIPNSDTKVTNPEGAEYDSDHIFNASGTGGATPNEAQSGNTLSIGYSSVGIGFSGGPLSLISVPNFDFGANDIDGNTRFVPLYANANVNVGNANGGSGAYVDSLGNLVGADQYRSLIVSDGRLPFSGSVNGWWITTRMGAATSATSSGSSVALNGTNNYDHWSDSMPISPDPNPDYGTNTLGNAQQLPVAIEMGNGFGSNISGQNGNSNYFTIADIANGQSGNTTQVSHPGIYYNADPSMSIPDTGKPSRWIRMDSVSTGLKSDTDTSDSAGPTPGKVPPRLDPDISNGTQSSNTVATSKNNLSRISSISGPNNNRGFANTNNTSVATIPMSDTANNLWGFTTIQGNAATGGGLSGGAWALDFQDKGSAIFSLLYPVPQTRAGTYVYNVYWTLNSGFNSNP